MGDINRTMRKFVLEGQGNIMQEGKFKAVIKIEGDRDHGHEQDDNVSSGEAEPY